MKIVGLSGSVTRPSRTTALVRGVLDLIEKRTDEKTRLFELVDEAPRLFEALTRSALTARAKAVIDAIEDCDLLVVGTPVYRASYTGAFKHVFDLVDHRAFVGKPILLTSTGGTPLHGLVNEHALRPLFGFLNALTIQTTVYAVESDFVDYRLHNPKTRARIERSVEEALAQLLRFPAVLDASPRIAVDA